MTSSTPPGTGYFNRMLLVWLAIGCSPMFSLVVRAYAIPDSVAQVIFVVLMIFVCSAFVYIVRTGFGRDRKARGSQSDLLPDQKIILYSTMVLVIVVSLFNYYVNHALSR